MESTNIAVLTGFCGPWTFIYQKSVPNIPLNNFSSKKKGLKL